jgi:hypothetical protein
MWLKRTSTNLSSKPRSNTLMSNNGIFPRPGRSQIRKMKVTLSYLTAKRKNQSLRSKNQTHGTTTTFNNTDTNDLPRANSNAEVAVRISSKSVHYGAVEVVRANKNLVWENKPAKIMEKVSPTDNRNAITTNQYLKTPERNSEINEHKEHEVLRVTWNKLLARASKLFSLLFSNTPNHPHTLCSWPPKWWLIYMKKRLYPCNSCT